MTLKDGSAVSSEALSVSDTANLMGIDDPAIMNLSVDDRPAESEAHLFHEMLLTELPRYYDEVDATFPSSIVKTARLGKDPNGYFTASKSLYVGRLDGEAAAFTVATRKRGGSVKIGPTVVAGHLRRSGVGLLFRVLVEQDLLADDTVRKFYSTISTANTKTLLLSMRLGYHVEGVLCDQYRPGSREVVMGKIVRPCQLDEVPRRSLPLSPLDEIHVHEGPVDTTELAEYLLPAMSSGYHGLDMSYIEAIMRALHPQRQDYQGKGKKLVVTRTAGRLSGAAVLVPKRGGALKLSPLIADDAASLDALIHRCTTICRKLSRRRVYAIVSEIDTGTTELLARHGFSIEAQLREAYHPGIDAVVLGRLL